HRGEHMRYFTTRDGFLCNDRPGNTCTHEDDHWTEVQVVPLDAIVIRRDELPGLDVDRHGTVRVDGLIEAFSPHYKPEEARARGVAWVALAEHLREHPLVDEAQVEALARILAKRSAEKRGAIGPGWRSFAEDARH